MKINLHFAVIPETWTAGEAQRSHCLSLVFELNVVEGSRRTFEREGKRESNRRTITKFAFERFRCTSWTAIKPLRCLESDWRNRAWSGVFYNCGVGWAAWIGREGRSGERRSSEKSTSAQPNAIACVCVYRLMHARVCVSGEQHGDRDSPRVAPTTRYWHMLINK